MINLVDHIATIPDFPKPGILFYDISTLLYHPPAWQETIDKLSVFIRHWQPDILAGIESRGFLVAAPLALALQLPFVMLRKQGKLPGDIIGHDYALEYGMDRLEIQAQAIDSGQRVVILDDLLATGGTLQAAIELVHKSGGEVVGSACIIELAFLKGRARFSIPCETLIQYNK